MRNGAFRGDFLRMGKQIQPREIFSSCADFTRFFFSERFPLMDSHWISSCQLDIAC